MKLASKLCAILILEFVVILAIDAYAAARSESADFLADMEHDAILLGHAMRSLLIDVWAANGEDRALRLIDEANREEDDVQMRWVWLEGAKDRGNTPRVATNRLEALRHGEEASFQVAGAYGSKQLVAYVPVKVPGGRWGALELSESFARLQAHNRKAIGRALTVMAVLLTAGGGSVMLLGMALVARPLGSLSAMVRRIGQGDLAARLQLHTGDELSELAEALNKMSQDLAESRNNLRQEIEARIAAIEQLRHADRLATVGRLASGVAHEVGTPLNVISARAKQIRTGSRGDAEIEKHATIIGAQSERIAVIVRQLLAFARPNRGEKKPLDLGALGTATANLLAPLAEKSGVALRVVSDDDQPIVEANHGQMQQVLTNLVVNAIQAISHGGSVEIRVGRHRAVHPGCEASDMGEYACLRVSDDGKGIAEEELPRIFDPFFTTKDVGEGTGLGLSLASEIVREHGGWIQVRSELGKGSCFSVYLPLDELRTVDERGNVAKTQRQAE
jgi:signal transduction histidine kinase